MGQRFCIYSVGTVSSQGIGNDELCVGLNGPAGTEDEITEFEVHEDSPGVARLVQELKISDFFPSIKSYVDKTTALALKAAFEAIPSDFFRTEVLSSMGLVFASEYGCTNTMKLYGNMGIGKGWRFAPPFLFINSYPNTPAAMIHIELGMKGYSNVFSGSIQSSEHAITDALFALNSGQSDLILAGAAESLTQERYNALFNSGVLGDFDEPKENSIPGEAGAFLLISCEENKTAALVSGRDSAMGSIDLIESDITPAADYIFICNEDERYCGFSGEAVDLAPYAGRCSSAMLPLSIAAFLLSDKFASGRRAVFPLASISRHFLIVEKRR